MKKIVLLIFIIVSTLAIYAEDISGVWHGVLKVQGTQLSLIFHINQAEQGYISTMDSPDQGAKGIAVTSTSFVNNTLKMEITEAGILYEGSLNEERVIIGTFHQRGNSFPMNLSREKIEKVEVIRPQEPAKPYPYYSEEVKFSNPKADAVLAGTLTLPQKEGNFPAVILITGSGPQNRNEEMRGHKPFLILADHLTRNGIAVLRFDDRGTAESTGIYKGATTLDFADDVESTIQYLQTRSEIDKNHIGLAGHSEGGIIAPLVAAINDDVDFIVLMAGTGIQGDQLLLLQQELIG